VQGVAAAPGPFDVTLYLLDDPAMAKTIITQITDDLDGSKDATTVNFAFDGIEYTIDLSKKNRAALEKALEPYIQAGSKVGGRRAAPRGGHRSTPAHSTFQMASVRAWAAENGYEVSERGRISKTVWDAYAAAH
jgi:hypothetical protein